jgi:hypothetical protein
VSKDVSDGEKKKYDTTESKNEQKKEKRVV